MNAKAKHTAADDFVALGGVSNGLMDLLDAAVGGRFVPVTAEALGECLASEMCKKPDRANDPRARTIKLDTGAIAEVIITQKGLACHAAFAAPK